MVRKSPSRRSVLKATAAGGALSFLPGAGSAASSDARDVTLVDKSVRSKDLAAADVRAAVGEDVVDSLADKVESYTGFSLSTDEYVSMELETDEPELNGRDPSVLHLPMKPSDEEYSTNNGGVLMAMIAEADSGDRVPVATIGITRETVENTFSKLFRLDSGPEVVTRAFGDTGDGLGKVAEHRESLSPAVGDGAMSTSAAIPDLTCFACTSIISIACAGAIYIGYESCLSAALASSYFGIWATAAAGTFCTYIVANANTLSCAAGVAVICAGAGFCQVVE